MHRDPLFETKGKLWIIENLLKLEENDVEGSDFASNLNIYNFPNYLDIESKKYLLEYAKLNLEHRKLY